MKAEKNRTGVEEPSEDYVVDKILQKRINKSGKVRGIILHLFVRVALVKA